jgi:hypothetical protein
MNNPLRLTDPTGRDGCDDLGSGDLGSGDGGSQDAARRARVQARRRTRSRRHAMEDPVCGGTDVGGALGSGISDIPTPAPEYDLQCSDPACSSSQLVEIGSGALADGGFSAAANDIGDLPLGNLGVIAPGVVQGAGGIADPGFVAGFYGVSFIGGVASSAEALSLIADTWTNVNANLGTWQMFDPAGYGDAVDFINNWLPSAPGITSTGAGALEGYLAGQIWNPIDGWNITK